MNLVDLQPTVDFGFQILQSVVMTTIMVVLPVYIGRWFHISAQSQLGQQIMATASNAAALGLSKAQTAADAATSAVDVKSAAVAAGVEYFNTAVSSGKLSAAKISAPIDAMIEAQVQKLLTPAQQAVVVSSPPPAATQ